jgi:hypothetical protein
MIGNNADSIPTKGYAEYLRTNTFIYSELQDCKRFVPQNLRCCVFELLNLSDEGQGDDDLHTYQEVRDRQSFTETT